MVTCGVSRGMEEIGPRAAERRKNTPCFFFRPIRGLAIFMLGSHGSRRRLLSNAAPQLFPRFWGVQI
jgi:hypothetical protein